jgi:PAS domain S-box-containing protein
LNRIQDGISIVQNGKIIYSNRRFKEIFGIKEEIEEREFTIFDYVTPEDADRLYQIRKNAIENNDGPPELSFWIIRSDGERRFIKNRYSRIGNKEESIRLILTSDITEEYIAEENYREHMKKFQFLFNQSPIGSALGDMEGKVVLTNQALADITGYSIEELLDLPFSNYTHPDDLEEELALYQELLDGRKDFYQIEKRYIKKQGEEIEVNVIASVIRDSEGKPINTIGLIQDLTEQKKMVSELKFQADILNLVNDSIFLVNLEGDIVYANQRAYEERGYSKEEFLKLNLTDLVVGDYFDKIEERIKRVSSGEELTFDTQHMTKNGSILEIEFHTRSITLDEELFILAVSRDIGEKKKSSRKIEELNDSLRVINSILRHDLNNDLTILDFSIEAYRNSGDKTFLDKAIKASDKSIKLIEQMHNLEKSLITENSLRYINANKVIREVISDYNLNNVNIELEGEGLILGDDSFYSVIDNLISNSIKHGNADSIKIEISTIDETCKIVISDNGEGIPDDIKLEIYNQGFKYGKNAGTGLGLFIVSKTIERYGGSINLCDNNPNGAVFTLSLKAENTHQEREKGSK